MPPYVLRLTQSSKSTVRSISRARPFYQLLLVSRHLEPNWPGVQSGEIQGAQLGRQLGEQTLKELASR
jgi:hypothetical protein